MCAAQAGINGVKSFVEVFLFLKVFRSKVLNLPHLFNKLIQPCLVDHLDVFVFFLIERLLVLPTFRKLLIFDLLQLLLQITPLHVVLDKYTQLFGLRKHVRQFGGSECLKHVFTFLKIAIKYDLVFHGPLKSLLLF